jgi:hypothetical protein
MMALLSRGRCVLFVCDDMCVMICDMCGVMGTLDAGSNIMIYIILDAYNIMIYIILARTYPPVIYVRYDVIYHDICVACVCYMTAYLSHMTLGLVYVSYDVCVCVCVSYDVRADICLI